MKYINFAEKIKTPIFTLNDINFEKLNVFPYQLTEWVKKGYLIRLKNGIYVFADKRETLSPSSISFHLYQPSYLSLEWALAEYGIIPETVYNYTAVSAKATRKFVNEFGVFIYRSVKREMFFGYRKIKEKNKQVYLLADPEKAFLDFLYLNSSKIKNQADFESFRFNRFELKKLSKKKIRNYCKIINNKQLNSSVELCFQLMK